MIIFGIVLLCLTVVSLIWFIVTNQKLIVIRKEFASLAKEKGITVNQKTIDINKMRSLHGEIKSDSSKALLETAESAVKNYLLSFRVFLFFMILGVVLVCFIKD